MSIPRKHYARCRGVSLSVSPGEGLEGSQHEQVCDCGVIDLVIEDAVGAVFEEFPTSERYLVNKRNAVATAVKNSTRKES